MQQTDEVGDESATVKEVGESTIFANSCGHLTNCATFSCLDETEMAFYHARTNLSRLPMWLRLHFLEEAAQATIVMMSTDHEDKSGAEDLLQHIYHLAC